MVFLSSNNNINKRKNKNKFSYFLIKENILNTEINGIIAMFMLNMRT